jgi:hypothetical protein
MKKAITRHAFNSSNQRLVVKKEKTQVEFKTKAGKIIRVEAFKTSIPKVVKKRKSLSRKESPKKPKNV